MADSKPNIAFVLADNVGWGDWSCDRRKHADSPDRQVRRKWYPLYQLHGRIRVHPHQVGAMTGRQSVRSGTYTVVPGAGPGGLTPWEYTIANLLSDAGYATSLYGKWHMEEIEGRLPTDQGFDEWWGYRNSAYECGWTSYVGATNDPRSTSQAVLVGVRRDMPIP